MPDPLFKKPTCPRCGEDRLVSDVADVRGKRFYCDVCSWSWRPPVKGKIREIVKENSQK